jgi:hypothetical protein
MNQLRLWLDDEREIPDEYNTVVRTVEQAKALIMQGNVEAISLDNDLGVGYTQGHELAKWIKEEAIAGRLAPLSVSVHTGNPWYAIMMWGYIEEAMNAWGI